MRTFTTQPRMLRSSPLLSTPLKKRVVRTFVISRDFGTEEVWVRDLKSLLNYVREQGLGCDLLCRWVIRPPLTETSIVCSHIL